jgi:hypothetical protein
MPRRSLLSPVFLAVDFNFRRGRSPQAEACQLVSGDRDSSRRFLLEAGERHIRLTRSKNKVAGPVAATDNSKQNERTNKMKTKTNLNAQNR